MLTNALFQVLQWPWKVCLALSRCTSSPNCQERLGCAQTVVPKEDRRRVADFVHNMLTLGAVVVPDHRHAVETPDPAGLRLVAAAVKKLLSGAASIYSTKRSVMLELELGSARQAYA
jgi:hypothetical protein